MNKWYYLVKSQIQGPVTENEIREKLKLNELTLHSIIFREGDTKWRRVSEFEEVDFAKEISEVNLHHFVKLPQKPLGDDRWVVLLNIQNESETKFVQKGPFSTLEVKDSIQQGEFSYSDYIWKDGFSKWERIGDLDDFSFRGETQIFSISPLSGQVVPSTEELAKAVEENANNEPDEKTVIHDSLSQIKIQRRPFLKGDESAKKEVDLENSLDLDKLDSEETTFDQNPGSLKAPEIKIQQKAEDLKESVRAADKSKEIKPKNALKDVETPKIPEMTKSQALSLKLDKTRLKELIGKSGPDKKNEDAIEKLDFTRSGVDVGGNFQKAKLSVSMKKLALPKDEEKTEIYFEEDKENRQEASFWTKKTSLTKTATRSAQVNPSQTQAHQVTKTGQRRKSSKRRVWNKVFKFAQLTLVLVIIATSAILFKNLSEKRRLAEERASASIQSKAPAAPAQPPPPKPIKKETHSEQVEPQAVVKEIPDPNDHYDDGVADVKAPKEETTNRVEKNLFEPLPKRTGKPFVRIKVLGPKIKIPSNANDNEKIKVTLKAITGEVVAKASYELEVNVKRRKGSDAELNLANYSIPSGYYTIVADLADAHAELPKTFLGNHKIYDKKINEFRKEISYKQQYEKKTLLKLTADLSSVAEELFKQYAALGTAGEWNQFYDRWSQDFRRITATELRQIANSNRNEFAFPDAWFEVRELREKLRRESETLNSAFVSARKTAANPSAELLEELKKTLSRIGELSGWRQKR